MYFLHRLYGIICKSDVWKRFLLCNSCMYIKKLHSKPNFNYIGFVAMEIRTAYIFCVAYIKEVSGVLVQVWFIDLQKSVLC